MFQLLSLLCILFWSDTKGYKLLEGSDEANLIITAHTNARDDVRNCKSYAKSGLMPKPANMLHMTYSNEMAQSAEEWGIEACNRGYTQCTHKNDWTNSMDISVGENLGCSGDKYFIAHFMTTMIDDERAKYGWTGTDKGTCNGVADNKCGHFTQIIWHDTEKVGCAINECSNMLICHYSAGGNYPTAPYTALEECVEGDDNDAWYVNKITTLEGCYLESGSNDGVAAYSGPNGYWLYRMEVGYRKTQYWLVSDELGAYDTSNGKCKKSLLEQCNEDSRGWDMDVKAVKSDSCAGWYVNEVTAIEGCYLESGSNDGVAAYSGPNGYYLYRMEVSYRKTQYWLISTEVNSYDVSNGKCKKSTLEDCNEEGRGWDQDVETRAVSSSSDECSGKMIFVNVKENKGNVNIIVFVTVLVLFVMMIAGALFCWMRIRKRKAKHEKMKTVVEEESDEEEEEQAQEQEQEEEEDEVEIQVEVETAELTQETME